jgi:protocatechuate 3,4-dioxygenase beta subunit
LTRLTRRQLLQFGAAIPAVGLAGYLLETGEVAAGPLQATPTCDDGDDPTPELTEGPVLLERLAEAAFAARPGRHRHPADDHRLILTTACKPVRGAKLEFWQADARGQYDTDGYRLRGHQFTDAVGRYRLDTIVPGLYTGRTKHIHVKVQRPGGRVLTTQLFFPGVSANRWDRLYDRDVLLGRWRKPGAWRTARFDFVLV